MGKGKRRKRRKSGRRKVRALAAAADRYRLYQSSVQSPEADIEFFEQRFRESAGREPVTLREDFCGTALLSAAWLARDEKRRVLAIDRDPAPLDWGRSENFAVADLERADLRLADVRDVRTPRVDLACAMNFSFCVFKSRKDLKSYLEAVHDGLVADGVFICELYGGTEAIVPIEERREVENFTFVWEQDRYNPLTNETLCHIHFELEDGSRLDKAFTYDWRLWTVPEVRELLVEAGFESVDVYWEEVDDDGDGTGNYRETSEEENQEGWLVFLVAAKARDTQRRSS